MVHGSRNKPYIAGIRMALPERTLSNEELAQEFSGWTAARIHEKTGIRERRIADRKTCASDLSTRAVRELFDEQLAEPNQIDFLLNCTQTPDYLLPPTACLLQERLGLPRDCGALDFNLGCSGFVYGLGLAKGLIETDQAKTVLLVTADTYSRLIHPQDRSTRTLFGDAAAATLIRTGDSDSLIGPFHYGTDGSGAENLIVRTGGMKKRHIADAKAFTDDMGNCRTENDLFLDGREVFHFALDVVPGAVQSLLDQTGLKMDDIDLFVFHQANRFMLEHLRLELEIPSARFLIAMENVGNTVSASIPIALHKAMASDRLKEGDIVMLVGFGVGYSWAATLLQWVVPSPGD